MAEVSPLVLVTGPETLLAERAVAGSLAALRDRAPDLEVVRLTAAGYQRGALALEASPSLFGGDKAVVVQDADELDDALQQDLLDYLAAPAPDTTLVVVHKGGVRGKKVLDELKRRGARLVDCPPVKTDRDKRDFVTGEFRGAGRKVTGEAVVSLVEAVGKDLRELAAACAQLVADTAGTVDVGVVERYYGGRVEATGFRVADAAVAGDPAEALRLLRHAIASGLDPVPIVAVLASTLRTLVRVGAAGRGRSADVARQLGLAPWQVDRARRSLVGWSPDGLGRSIQAVAAADFDVKGGGRDPVYAVERAILVITAQRAGS
ncbi:MAG TPA: DNA polymerase III subunit delta [Dermatophilaceae bacterium]|nr:DNA polymerase III subunit delta [Dermatophilaceae bacterium]